MLSSSTLLKINFATNQTLEIKSLLKDTKGMLSAKYISWLQNKYNVTLDELLTNLLSFAADFSVAPISNFHVGAIVVGALEICILVLILNSKIKHCL